MRIRAAHDQRGDRGDGQRGVRCLGGVGAGAARVARASHAAADPGRPDDVVGGGGADALLGELRAALAASEVEADLITVGALGFSFAQPTIEVHLPGKQPVVYGPVLPGQGAAFVAAAIEGRAPTSAAEGGFDPIDVALGVRRAGSTLNAPAAGQEGGVPSLHEHPYWGPQERRVMEWMGVIDPEDVDEAISVGRYAALAKALAMEPMEICDLIEAAGVGGRGGAAFPAGRKWKFLLGSPGPLKYVLLNADEGDPGAFVNRVLMESDPHLVLEGLAIAGRATGSTHGYIYIRDEYPLAIARMQTAIEQATSRGLLGEHVLGSATSIVVEIVQGAGSYVCGEETGLIASLEGLRGMPKIRPPFPAERGVFGLPSNVNNTETYAHVPLAVGRGAAWYREQGTESDPGSKMFSISGTLARSGIVEVPFGYPMDALLNEMGGGVPQGRTAKGIQPGGPLGGLLHADHLALPLERPPFAERGVLLGSGGLILFDDRTCPVDLAHYFIVFCEDESCGRCTTCHGGSQRIVEILDRIMQGGGKESDLEQLGLLDATLQNSNCIHGQFTPYAIRGLTRHFCAELREHIVEKHCRAQVCAGLIQYRLLDPQHTDLELAAELEPSGTLVREGEGWKLNGRGAEQFGVLPEVAPEAVAIERSLRQALGRLSAGGPAAGEASSQNRPPGALATSRASRGLFTLRLALCRTLSPDGVLSTKGLCYAQRRRVGYLSGYVTRYRVGRVRLPRADGRVEAGHDPSLRGCQRG